MWAATAAPIAARNPLNFKLGREAYRTVRETRGLGQNCGAPIRKRMSCAYSKLRSAQNAWRFWHSRHAIVGMITILFALVSLLSFRVRSRASLELELVALRHQVTVLRRQRPGRARLFCADRLLWVWLYRVWPQVLNAMVLVKPATVIQWHRKGFRLYWRWRSRRLGRPKMKSEIRDLIRQMSLANPL